MTELLHKVSRTARNRRRALEDYRAAVIAASAQHSETQIAAAAGIAQSSVSRMLSRWRGRGMPPTS